MELSVDTGTRHSRACRLTPPAREALENALAQWWKTSEEREYSKTGKLTREQKAVKLQVQVKTLDSILKGKGADKSTLQHVFRQVDIAWREEYCLAETADALGGMPALPALMLGREDALRELKQRLIGDKEGSTRADTAVTQVLTAMRGWPGVGKTTLAATLAHDPDMQTAFPDGVLWTSLGTEPNILSTLIAWGCQLHQEAIRDAKTVEEASAHLAAALRHRRMLLIVDDVWQQEHALPFRVGGAGCALLLTTRSHQVAHALALRPQNVYVLPVLTEDAALQVLNTLAPAVVARHEPACRELCRELEGLPLALHVAGRLLHEEQDLGFDVEALLQSLRDGVQVLAATAPADRADIAAETTPTVAALLQKSTDRLAPQTRHCFALLGPFAPKPATFDLDALQSVWEMPDAKPVVKTLVGRGLLEPVGDGRFQMHALLVSHALSLLTE